MSQNVMDGKHHMMISIESQKGFGKMNPIKT